jgi:hypothetical protein
MPKARTAADRLSMKGDPVTVDSIRSTVEEQLKQAREKLENPYVKSGFTRFKLFIRRLFTQNLPALLRGLGKVLMWLLIISALVALLSIGAVILSVLFGGVWNPFV